MSQYYLDVLNQTRMGRYLDTVETSFVRASFAAEPGLRAILEIGGGVGRLAVPLAEQGFQVGVVEVDGAALEILAGRSAAVRRYLVRPEDQRWPVDDGSQDCALAMQVPMVGQAWFWQECRRVVKPGGIVIACVSNSRSYKGWFHRARPWLRPFLPERDKPWAHNRYYPRAYDEILSVALAHGFTLEQAQGYNWAPLRRNSDFFLIPALGRVEKALGLRNLPAASPLALIKARAH